jgi:hypothetical protein
MPPATTLAGTELISGVQSAANVSILPSQIKTYLGVAVASGKTITVSNSLTLAGTDGTTMTFPATSQAIAGLGQAQTFTGNQTFSGQLLAGDGTSSLPGYAFSGATNTGFYRSGNQLEVVIGGALQGYFNGNNAAFVLQAGVIQLLSTTPNLQFGGGTDANISRIGAGILGIGTGAQGNVTGGLNVGNITITSAKILQLGNAATTGLTPGVLAATTNATIVISDSSGQAYRIPCII